jgi:sterol 14alpha-demethylase
MMSQGAHFFLTTMPNPSSLSVWAQILIVPIAFVALSIARHIINQLVFSNKDEPPLVFSWLPLIGSTIEYGQDPYKFYFKYQKKVGAEEVIICMIIEVNM